MTLPFILDSGLLAGTPSLTGLLGNGPAPQAPGPQPQASNTPDPLAPLLSPAVQPETQPLGGALPIAQQSPLGGLLTPHPAPNSKRGLLARVHDALLSGVLAPVHAVEGAGHAIGQFAENQAIGPTPTSYGDLTPEQIQAARPSFLQALFGASPGNLGSDMYRNNLEFARIQKLRSDIYKEVGAPENGDIANSPAWVAKAFPKLLLGGDVKAAEALAPTYNSLVKPLSGAPQKADVFVDPKGQQHFLTPTGNTVIPEGWTLLQNGSGDASSNQDLYRRPDGRLQYLKKGSEVPAGWERQQDAMTIWKDAQTQNRFDKTKVVQLQRQFRTDVAPIVKNAMQYDKALTTLDRAANSPDPNERKALYGSLYSQFVQSGDQPNNLRFQLLQYYEHNINPSIAGRFDIFLDKLTKGELPPKILAAMTSHIKVLANQAHDQLEKRRSEFLQNNSSMIDETQVPTPDTYFTFPGITGTGAGSAPAPAPTANAADLYKKYKLTPRTP